MMDDFRSLSKKKKDLIAMLYNLASDDSTRLVEMDQKDKEIYDLIQSDNEKRAEYLELIEKYEEELSDLKNEGEDLKKSIFSITGKDYSTLFRVLNLDLDFDKILSDIEIKIPKTMNELNVKIDSTQNALDNICLELENAETSRRQIELRRQAEVENMTRLAEYINVAKKDELGANKKEIFELLSLFDINGQDAIECSKLLLYPAEGFWIYDEYQKSKEKAEKLRVVETYDQKSIDELLNPEKNVKGISNVEQDPVKEESTEDLINIDEKPKDDIGVDATVDTYQENIDEIPVDDKVEDKDLAINEDNNTELEKEIETSENINKELIDASANQFETENTDILSADNYEENIKFLDNNDVQLTDKERENSKKIISIIPAKRFAYNFDILYSYNVGFVRDTGTHKFDILAIDPKNLVQFLDIAIENGTIETYRDNCNLLIPAINNYDFATIYRNNANLDEVASQSAIVKLDKLYDEDLLTSTSNSEDDLDTYLKYMNLNTTIIRNANVDLDSYILNHEVISKIKTDRNLIYLIKNRENETDEELIYAALLYNCDKDQKSIDAIVDVFDEQKKYSFGG